jgi:hypothetical protein
VGFEMKRFDFSALLSVQADSLEHAEAKIRLMSGKRKDFDIQEVVSLGVIK